MIAPVEPGEILAGKYKVERVLGQGGMGVVVAAMHVELDERVALKFLQPCSVDRFPAGSRGLEPRSEEAGRDVAEGILCRLTALPGRFGGLDGVVTRPDRVWSAYPPPRGNRATRRRARRRGRLTSF
jgi:hypothetical protein